MRPVLTTLLHAVHQKQSRKAKKVWFMQHCNLQASFTNKIHRSARKLVVLQALLVYQASISISDRCVSLHVLLQQKPVTEYTNNSWLHFPLRGGTVMSLSLHPAPPQRVPTGKQHFSWSGGVEDGPISSNKIDWRPCSILPMFRARQALCNTT